MAEGRLFHYRFNPADCYAEIDEMSIEERGRFLTKICRDLVKGESDNCFISGMIEEARKYIETKKLAGKKGGEAKSSSAKAVLSSAIAEPSTPLASSSSSSSSSTVAITPQKQKEETKVKYLDFVFLTETENAKLIERFGEAETLALKERLNNYVGSKGKKYKSHYFTMLNWKNKDAPKEKIIVSEKTPEEECREKIESAIAAGYEKTIPSHLLQAYKNGNLGNILTTCR